METKMRKTVLSALSVLLIYGSVAQTSTASARHIHEKQVTASKQFRNANALRSAIPGPRVYASARPASLKLTGGAVPSLIILAPTMAMHQRYHYRDGHDLPVQDAVHFGYGSGRCGYHSGYGGLYGDGLYPGDVCEDGGSHLID
jgi:hypothetical protein